MFLNEGDLRKQIQKLYGLIEASTLVISTLQIEEVLHLVMEIAERVVNAQASCLALLDSQTQLLSCEVALGEKGDEVKKKFSIKLGQGITGWVAQHGEPLLVPDVEKDERFYRGFDQQTGFKTRSVICVPMAVHDKMIGVIEVLNPKDGDSFSTQDLELLKAFSSLAGIAIENARLTQQKLEQQALEQELLISRQIQENLLRKEFPELKTLEFCARVRSAHEIGGDFYDLVDLGRGQWGAIIGDVSGRGIPAALYMVEVISEFRLEAFLNSSLSKLFKQLNECLFKRAALGMFVTLSYLVIQSKTGLVEMANAGHLHFYIVRGSGRKLKKIRGGKGIPLGILPKVKISTQRFKLKKGDLILLLTDGLIEARNPQGEEFGWTRLEDYLRNLPEKITSCEVVRGIFALLDQFCGHFAHPDDVTLFAIKYKGSFE